MQTSNDDNEKLLVEYFLRESLRKYAKRLTVFFLIVLANFLVFSFAFLVAKFPTQVLLILAVLIGLFLVTTILVKVRQYMQQYQVQYERVRKLEVEVLDMYMPHPRYRRLSLLPLALLLALLAFIAIVLVLILTK